MKRILIIGNCGTGKTTFARELSKRLHLPLIHLDQYYWKSNWVKTSQAEWEQIVKTLVSKNTWIIEGNYRSSFNIRIPRADTIIF